MIKIGKFEIRNVTDCYTYDYLYFIPTIEYRHKYWYLWDISLLFLDWHFNIEICREDWDKYIIDEEE